MLVSQRGMALSLVMSALLVLAGCGKKAEEPAAPGQAEPAAKIVVGVLVPLTGPDGAKGQAVLAGLKLALKQKGASVGLDESSLEVKDCGQPMSDVLGLARALVDVEGCSVLVGPLDAKGAESVEELGRQKGVPIFTTASGAMKLGVLDCTVRRLTFSDEEEGAAMAELAAAKGLREAAVLVDAMSPASDARAKAFADRFGRLGGRVVTQVAYSKDDKDFRRTVRMAAFQKPGVYYLTGARVDSAEILAEMKTQKVLGAILGSVDWDGGTFPVEVSAGAQVFVPTRFVFASRADSVASDFAMAFKQANARDPGAYDAFGYDAGLVIVDSLLRGGSLAERVGSVKMLAGATGRLTARPWSVAGQVPVLRLKGTSFEFDSTVEIK